MKVNSCVTDAHEINSDELKTTMKESPRRYTNPFLSDQENDELNLWNNQEHEHELSINEDNSITNLENEPVQPLQKAKEVYVDKKVTECQLPELMNVFHVVKDICVDNGISHDEKIEVDKKHHELSCNHVTLTDIDTDTNHTVIGDKYDDGISHDEKIEVDRKHHELSCNHVTVTNTDTETDHTVIGDKYDDGISHDEKIEVDEKHHELSCNHVTVTDTDTDIDHTVNGDKHDDVIENEQIISSPKEDCSKITNVEKPEGEEVEIVKPDTQIGPNQLQRGGGESSFSMVASVSGRIAYSGSISHRSDGSNTSVRSFAFPILQTEWNSSPVRMAKVDQRQSRKHRGWRQALMCCGF